MSSLSSDAVGILEREFLALRASLLSVAATLDRIDRAAGSAADDARRKALDEALAILVDGSTPRAERIQMLFSLPYDESWRELYNFPPQR